ncbi:MAG: protein kinase domain-containing protein [Acidobacteriota bacterium]
MPLTPGERLGPYEVLAPIGAGGMGEVWRARDPRLGRDVAIKVLPASFSADPDRLRRFEQEARAAGALNHPNLTAVYDVGEHEGSPYVVSELLEGETLGRRLAAGALPPRKATEIAVQIAHGLAAAHEKGIVHRDLKPENLFLGKDGRVKILDFGLAKLVRRADENEATSAPTASPGTEPGVVLGTVGYMSPEQVKGLPADHRSDVFSFGTILYEMLSGRRAFQRDTAAETMTAILKEDPPDLAESGLKISPGLDRIVRHCIEKNPSERFQSASDLAFDLQALSSAALPAPAAKARTAGRRPWLAAAGIALLAIYSAALFWAGRRTRSEGVPEFEQLTFRRGLLRQARFAPDGQTIVYAAAWDGKPLALFSTRPGSIGSNAFELPSAGILAIASTGQMALQLGAHATEPYVSFGTLAESPLTGAETPREILQGVQWADWSPDGKRIAVVRDIGGRNRLESPVGKVLYETSGWIGDPRFSPDSDVIALVNHWSRTGDMGSVMLVGRDGKSRTLSDGWSSLQGLAWRPDGREVWFTGTKSGGNRALHAVTLAGTERLAYRQGGSLTLQDISRQGEVLLATDDLRMGIAGQFPGDSRERDLSWLDFSAIRDLSPDGARILFDESAEGGGPDGTIYVRKTDGSPPVRLSFGVAIALSPDGRWALAANPKTRNTLRLLPVGPGEPRQLSPERFTIEGASWFSDGRTILVAGTEPGHGMRLYVQDVSGRDPAPRPVTPEGVRLIPYSQLISPDNRLVVVIAPDGVPKLFPIAGGEPRPIPGLAADELPCAWDGSGRFLFVYRPGELPARISRIEVATGARQPWKTLMPADPTGVTFIRPPHFSRDGEACAYSYSRRLSNLYLVRGLR